MKKYVTPILEEIQVEHINQLMDQSVSPWAEGKENNMFLFDDEEFDDENDLWGEKPNADKYDLWND